MDYNSYLNRDVWYYLEESDNKGLRLEDVENPYSGYFEHAMLEISLPALQERITHVEFVIEELFDENGMLDAFGVDMHQVNGWRAVLKSLKDTHAFRCKFNRFGFDEKGLHINGTPFADADKQVNFVSARSVARRAHLLQLLEDASEDAASGAEKEEH